VALRSARLATTGRSAKEPIVESNRARRSQRRLWVS